MDAPPIELVSTITGALSVRSGQFLHDIADETLGIAEKHQRLRKVIQLVVDAREAGAHAALDHHDGAGPVGIQDWGPINRTGFIGTGERIYYVVRTDHQCYVG